MTAEHATFGRDKEVKACDEGHSVTMWTIWGKASPGDALLGYSGVKIELETPEPDCPGCKELQRQIEQELAEAFLPGGKVRVILKGLGSGETS